MSASDSFVAHWYFHLPNMALAALIYTLIGRYLLSLLFGLDSDKVIMRVFRTITDPVLNAVGFVTPAVVPRGLVLIFAIVWLFFARIALFVGFAAAGLKPGIGG